MTDRSRLEQLVRDFPDSTYYARKLFMAKDEDYSDRQGSAPLIKCSRCQRSFYVTGRTASDPPFLCQLCKREDAKRS